MFELESKANKYLDLIKTEQDSSGFIESHECDSLLFTGLVGCLPEIKVNIDAAFDGQTWNRRPLDRPCCFKPENHKPLFQCLKEVAQFIWAQKSWKDSKAIAKVFDGHGSQISRDMLLGLAWYCWHNRRLDISEQIISYALKNQGVMGLGSYSRTWIGPGILSTYAWISYRLGGPSRAWLRWIPADSGADLAGFQAHLQVLSIMLRGELAGKYSKKESQTLEKQAQRQPNNPLFLHAVGQDVKALTILAREDLWPSDRLPTRGDRKTQWIPQRDDGDDWKPANDPEHKHSGGDFLFVYWLIKKKYK